MDIALFEHNEKAYKKAVEMLADRVKLRLYIQRVLENHLSDSSYVLTMKIN